MSASSAKRRIGRFHVVVVQWTSKKYTKKRDSRSNRAFAHKFDFIFDVVVVVA